MRPIATDLLAAARSVVRRPSAAAGVVATLAIGLAGAATAASIAHAGLVRPLPFPDADRLVQLTRVYTPSALASGLRIDDLDAWRARLAGTATLTGVSIERVVVRDSGTVPVEVNAGYVAGDFFAIHGVAPVAGRTFDVDEPAGVAVVSRDFARRFGGSPDAALGSQIDVAGRSLTVVGVMPDAFSIGADRIALWTSGRHAPPAASLAFADTRYYTLTARIEQHATVESFRDRATVVMNDLVPPAQRGSWQLVVTPLRDALVGSARTTLVLFVIASSLFLAVASANVAVLLINGIVSRSRETAIRLSLGASPWRLLRQHWLEAGWLIGAGALAGAGLAAAATRALAALPGVRLPALATLAPDVYLAAALGACGVLIVCGAAQTIALRQTRRAEALRGAASTASPASRRIRGALVLAQVAMAVVLVTSAGLLGRGFLDLAGTDIGLEDSDSAFTMRLPIGDSIAAPDEATRAVWIGDLLDRIRAIPGIDAAGIGGALPPAVGQLAFTVRRVTDTDDATTRFDVVSGTAGYLEALGVRLTHGRLFTAADTSGDDAVTVASASALRHLGMSPDDVGSTLTMALPSSSGERVRPRLIGVVEDVRFTGLAADDTGSLFIPWQRLPNSPAFLVVRSATDPVTAMGVVADVVRAADPTLPAAPPETMREVIDRSIAPESSRFVLVMACAAAAVLLAMVGLSGTLARWVVERRRELAIRAAIGATPGRLLRSTLARGVALAAAGAVVGAALSAWAGRLLASSIAGLRPDAPDLLAATVAGVLLLAAAAAAIPARRASKADPIALLRSE